MHNGQPQEGVVVRVDKAAERLTIRYWSRWDDGGGLAWLWAGFEEVERVPECTEEWARRNSPTRKWRKGDLVRLRTRAGLVAGRIFRGGKLLREVHILAPSGKVLFAEGGPLAVGDHIDDGVQRLVTLT
ncbi:hypothetical protein A3709_19035 [Halioglobus sp. HI00S01]|uniref:hypothetical protein n=1 Tax=Halioglobus sp. HI00S01 TaxID=1822214 RepID=UPI0007C2DE18|nr:hypothetical protein [Halioglobus sp. HI00S01]KZX57720.1 hypothetical protein A3709_19035 [Halioglobus sp. HI00S01]